MSTRARDMGLCLWSNMLQRNLTRRTAQFGGKDALWNAGVQELVRGLRIEVTQARDLIAAREGLDVDALDAQFSAQGFWFCDTDQPDFPAGVASIPDAPFGLFGCGDRSVLAQSAERKVVGILGSRRATSGSRDFARQLGRDLADAGVIVASGFSSGISEEAHTGSLGQGGMNMAVVATGVDVPYPRRFSRGVRHDLLKGAGVLLSEEWPGSPAAPWRFPPRLRIVAGLVDALVIVEASSGSSSLLAADFALELGRPVLAVPHCPWRESGRGGNQLLRAGATLCEGAQDIIDAMDSLDLGASGRMTP